MPTYKLDKGICAPNVSTKGRGKGFKTCYSRESLIKIAETWNKNNPDKPPIKTDKKTSKYIWSEIQKRLYPVCKKDEYCWKKQEFVKKIKDPEIQLYTFKPEYPKEWLKGYKNMWLSTYDIYYVMKQFEKAHDDFVFLGPIPADCPIKIQCELSKLDIKKMKDNKIHKIGIVYNLDVHTSSGSHWVAIYIDNKNNEINYFDSYGGIPTPLIRKFIERISDQYEKNNITPIVIFNDKRYQYKKSECGMYSMNFILERLNGKTMYDIYKMKIPDDHMISLRNILYKKI